MKEQRFGLQARFVLGVVLVLAVGAALLSVLLLRQGEMQREVGELGRAAVHDVATRSLQLRGEAATQRLAESLANPLYYSDLNTIRTVLGTVIRQPDVTYALVFDADGAILHDGTLDIADYGQPMRDPLAARAVASDALLVQWAGDIMDVSQGIHVGDQRLGGVRIGYSLRTLRTEEGHAAGVLEQRLAQPAKRYMVWFAALLAALAGVCILAIWYVQHTLVTPVRQLVRAARAIGGGRYDMKLPVSERTDEIGALVRAFASMGASIASHNREARRIAYSDTLTGLANRLAFREALDSSLAGMSHAGEPLALLFLDLDGFKNVNDKLGHDAGDAVLMQVATRIRSAVARTGGEHALAARLGGDEFVIMLRQGDVRSIATQLAAQLVADIHQPMPLQAGQVANIGTSIGISLFPEHATEAARLMKCGDVAMYQAKLAGKDCWRLYDHSME
ncbi:MAG: GGDEF domain-containing protein [Steroidobacteraceae bacterium]